MKLTLLVWAAAAASLFAQDKVMSFTASGPVGLEAMVGGAIKGQPYSADVVTETVQVLGDGTRITNKSKSFVARDSQGRTRNETPVQVLKAQLAGDAPVKIVMIHDPNAGFTYTLDATNKTARKIAVPTHASSPAMAALTKACLDRGLLPFVNFNRLHVVPPCVITEDDARQGLAVLDEALSEADGFYTGA